MLIRLCCIAVLIPGACFGQEISEEVIVAGKRKAVPASAVSYTDLVSADIAYQLHGQEPAFLLQKTPSITSFSDSGGYQGYAYMRLRGMDQTRINMTLNGAPLNEPEDQGVYFSNYSGFLGDVSAIQIQRGVGIVQQGGASYAGSMQFSSPRVESSPSASLSANLASYNSKQVRAEITTGKYEGLGARLSVNDQSSDGYKYRSANQSRAIFSSVEWQTEKALWMLTGFSGKQQNQMAWIGATEAQITEDRRTNANGLEDDEFQQNFLILNSEYSLSDQVSLSSALYTSALEGNYDFDVNNFLGFPSTPELYNYAFKSVLVGGFSNIEIVSTLGTTTIGMNINDYQRDHVGSEQLAGNLYKNTGFTNSYSAFMRHQKQWRQFSAELAVQQRKTEFSYLGAAVMEGQTWRFRNPFLGLSYKISDSFTAYISAGQTGREPTRNDMFGGMDDLGAREDGSPELYILDPEYVEDYEAGLRFGKQGLAASVNAFYMRFNNEIALVGQLGPNGLPLTQEVDASYRQGIELESDWALGPWLVSLAASLSEGKIREQNTTFSHVYMPRWIVQPSVRYDFDQWFIFADCRYQSESYVDFANEHQLPGYIVANLKAGFEYRNLTFVLHVNNITDKKYNAHGAVDYIGQSRYFVATPRNVALSAGYEW